MRKKRLKTRLLSLTILAVPVISAYEGDRTINGYFDTGTRDVFEDFDDEGIGDEYTYRNYQLKYEDTGFDRVEYGVSTFQKSRNYKNTNDLDNHFATYKGNVAYAFPTKAPLLAGLELRNKQWRTSYETFGIAVGNEESHIKRLMDMRTEWLRL